MPSLTKRNNRLLAEKELVDLITLHKRKQVDVLGYNPDSDTLLERFYQMLSNREVNSDEEAAAKLLGSKSTDNDYLKLKSNLKRRLTNTLFFIDLKTAEFNDAHRANQNVWKYLSSMHICRSQGARNAAIDVALKGIKPAIKYEMSLAVIEFARLFIEYSSVYTGNKAELDKYIEIAKKYQEIFIAEMTASNLSAKLIQPYVNKREFKKETNQLAKEYLKIVEPLAIKYVSHKVQGPYYQILIYEKYSQSDFVGLKKVTEEAIRTFENKNFEMKQTIGAFSIVLISANTILGDYEAAEAAAEKSLAAIPKGTPVWFNANRLYTIALLNASRYTEAYKLYRKCVAHKKFENLGDSMKELWWVMEGYFYLLMQAGEIAIEELEKRPENFRISTFLNRFALFSKDKRGMNICVQIIHILFHLFNKEYDLYEDKLSTLIKYKKRHLSNQEDGYRTTCFIECLQIIEREEFKKERAIAKTNDLRSLMSEVPQMLLDQPEEIEVLTYEKLWRIAELAMSY